MANGALDRDVGAVRNSWLTLLKNAVFAASSSPSFALASRSSRTAFDSSRLRAMTSPSMARVRSRSTSPSSLARTSSVTSSTRCRRYITSPLGESTGMFLGLQYFTAKAPSAPRMSYFCTAIVSGARVATARSSEARRLAVPVASGSSGLSGKASKSPRPMVSSRVVPVAARRARVAATIV